MVKVKIKRKFSDEKYENDLQGHAQGQTQVHIRTYNLQGHGRDHHCLCSQEKIL